MALRMVLFLACVLASQVSQANDELWARLKSEANLVVLMRHAESAGARPLEWDPSGQCKGEVMLTARGRDQARAIGQAFAVRGIQVAAVISSPMCRCSETARIAFGPQMTTDAELREVASADAPRMRLFQQTAQRLVAANRSKGLIVFVSHRPNIDQLSMELIDEGQLLVARAQSNGELEALGKITMPR